MALREATVYDCEDIAKFANELITKSKYGPILFKDLKLVSAQIPFCINLSDTRMIEKDGKIVGFVSYQTQPWININLGKILYVYIDPDFRHQGLMAEVKEDFEIWAKLRSCNFTMLGITTGADPSDYEQFEVMYMKEIK